MVSELGGGGKMGWPGGIVTLANRVARHFTRHCGNRPIESSGNCPKTQSLVAAPVNLIVFVHRQLAVMISHAYTLPNRGVALQSRARHAKIGSTTDLSMIRV